MTKRDSETTDNRLEQGPATAAPRTDDRSELVKSSKPGSPPAEKSEAEMYEPATKKILEGDAYGAVGNDEPHAGNAERQEPATGVGKNNPDQGSTSRGRKDGGIDRKRPKD